MYSFLQLTLRELKNLEFVIMTVIEIYIFFIYHGNGTLQVLTEKVYFLTEFLMSLLILFKPIEYLLYSKQTIKF